MSNTLPSIHEPQVGPVGAEDQQIQAEVKLLLDRGELPVQEITHQLRLRFPSDRIIAAITEMVRSGRIHMTDSYPIRLRIRLRSSGS